MAATIGGVEEIVSEGLRLGAHFARPVGLTRVPGLVVLPGFPTQIQKDGYRRRTNSVPS